MSTCHVAFEGTVEAITDQLVAVFGSGNFMAYEKHMGVFDLSTKTDLTDYVNISPMLNANNADVPMTYYISSQGGDNIVSVAIDGSETAYTEHSRISLPIRNGHATIRCHGNIPVTSAIVIYILLGLALLTLTSFIAIKLIKPKRRRVPDPLNGTVSDQTAQIDGQEDDETDPAVRASVTQTTTFSIFELNALVRNKKYVDEINKDVEERLYAQSLEEQKQDIRARELEEMSRKVYGDANSTDSTDTESETPEADAPESEDVPESDDAPENTAPAPDEENTDD